VSEDIFHGWASTFPTRELDNGKLAQQYTIRTKNNQLITAYSWRISASHIDFYQKNQYVALF
jgi:hypothetical protein